MILYLPTYYDVARNCIQPTASRSTVAFIDLLVVERNFPWLEIDRGTFFLRAIFLKCASSNGTNGTNGTNLEQTRFDHFRDPGLNTRKDGHFRDENV